MRHLGEGGERGVHAAMAQLQAGVHLLCGAGRQLPADERRLLLRREVLNRTWLPHASSGSCACMTHQCVRCTRLIHDTCHARNTCACMLQYCRAVNWPDS
jgi:hypothetical protein